MDEAAQCMHLEENVDLWYLSEHKNLLFDFLVSRSTILGQSINLDTTASDEDPMYSLTEVY